MAKQSGISADVMEAIAAPRKPRVMTADQIAVYDFSSTAPA